MTENKIHLNGTLHNFQRLHAETNMYTPGSGYRHYAWLVLLATNPTTIHTYFSWSGTFCFHFFIVQCVWSVFLCFVNTRCIFVCDETETPWSERQQWQSYSDDKSTTLATSQWYKCTFIKTSLALSILCRVLIKLWPCQISYLLVFGSRMTTQSTISPHCSKCDFKDSSVVS